MEETNNNVIVEDTFEEKPVIKENKEIDFSAFENPAESEDLVCISCQ